MNYPMGISAKYFANHDFNATANSIFQSPETYSQPSQVGNVNALLDHMIDEMNIRQNSTVIQPSHLSADPEDLIQHHNQLATANASLDSFGGLKYSYDSLVSKKPETQKRLANGTFINVKN